MMAENGAFRRLTGRSVFRARLGTLFALLAIAIQSFVVQPHVDAIAYGAPQIERVASVNPAAVQHSASGRSAPCIICQELAVAGAFLHATPPALSLIEHVITLRIAAPRAPATLDIPAHYWQSRAPPIPSS